MHTQNKKNERNNLISKAKTYKMPHRRPPPTNFIGNNLVKVLKNNVGKYFRNIQREKTNIFLLKQERLFFTNSQKKYFADSSIKPAIKSKKHTLRKKEHSFLFDKGS